jgi:hypothetical protein
LARLRGRLGSNRVALRGTAEWQTSEQAIRSSMERPDLRLDA